MILLAASTARRMAGKPRASGDDPLLMPSEPTVYP